MFWLEGAVLAPTRRRAPLEQSRWSCLVSLPSLRPFFCSVPVLGACFCFWAGHSWFSPQVLPLQSPGDGVCVRGWGCASMRHIYFAQSWTQKSGARVPARSASGEDAPSWL